MRGVEVVDVQAVFDGVQAEFVGGADGAAAADAAAGQDHREAVGIVVAAVAFSLIGVRPNSPPQMTSVSFKRPRRLRSLSRPARADRRRGSFRSGSLRGRSARPTCCRCRNRAARSARRARPAGGRAGTCGRSWRSPFDRGRRGPRLGGLLRQIDGFGRLGLHAEGQLVAGDAGFELRLLGPRRRRAGDSARRGGRASPAAARRSRPWDWPDT